MNVPPLVPPIGLTVVLCLSDGLQQQLVLFHADTWGGKGTFGGPIGRFGGHCGVLVGFGGPKGSLVPIAVSLWGLVALQWGLVALQDLWYP